ncbi:MAG: YggS family pyridoxal phosphate-dependent enzyme, partial [Alphaproteobacteria bacterium]|nr:YggS family pyridoxal phosphate-dependent enzyme [Alphaproteobacteria bacterium]
MLSSLIGAAIGAVRARIADAARGAGRDPASVTLVAVSKTFGADAVQAALDAGQRVFGENRVQEAAAKFPQLKARYPDLELHLIGPLQTNKAREAVALFDVIESVDREKLARELAKEMARAG